MLVSHKCNLSINTGGKGALTARYFRTSRSVTQDIDRPLRALGRRSCLVLALKVKIHKTLKLMTL